MLGVLSQLTVENSQQIPYFEDPGVGAEQKRTVSTWVLVVIRPFCFGEVRAARATVFICFGGWHFFNVFLDASLDGTR